MTTSDVRDRKFWVLTTALACDPDKSSRRSSWKPSFFWKFSLLGEIKSRDVVKGLGTIPEMGKPCGHCFFSSLHFFGFLHFNYNSSIATEAYLQMVEVPATHKRGQE